MSDTETKRSQSSDSEDAYIRQKKVSRHTLANYGSLDPLTALLFDVVNIGDLDNFRTTTS